MKTKEGVRRKRQSSKNSLQTFPIQQSDEHTSVEGGKWVGEVSFATEYRRQLVQMFQTFNTDLKQNGASNINASSTHLLSSFFPDCIVECLYPIFLQENPKPETEYTSARD